VVIAFLQAFGGLEARDESEWVEGLQVTLSSGNGTKVAFGPRKV